MTVFAFSFLRLFGFQYQGNIFAIGHEYQSTISHRLNGCNCPYCSNTKKDSAAAIDAVFDVIGTALQGKDKVQLIGFGTFGTSERKARTGKNPRTGEAVKIAACTVPSFKAGKALKDKVNTKEQV